jgi:hypothetical protein
MIRYAAAFALALAACSPSQPATLGELDQAHDWANEPGDKLNLAWAEGAIHILRDKSRPDAIKAITDAGFECIYGEAHEDYPDPMAVCTKSFATRACQMDWEIASTADKGKVDDVDASYKRDCVGTDKDWPDAVKSPIDDQLSPAQPAQ